MPIPLYSLPQTVAGIAAIAIGVPTLFQLIISIL